MKFVPVPAASNVAVKIGVPPLRVFNMITFVRAMLPVFVTVPL